MEWRQDVGYENGYPVAFLYQHPKNSSVLTVKVMGGRIIDNYFVSNTIGPITSSVYSEAKRLAETTRRIIRNQPNQEAAQVSLRAYARMKGDRWWDER